MGYYFPDELSIFSKTQDIKTVLETVANRYIGQNPPFGVSYYAYQKNGIRQDKHYRYVFDFADIYPLAGLETSVYAWSKLWSDDDMPMTFEISCFGPVIIYCNGERVFKPNVLIERKSELSASFTVKLKKGWNNFVLRFIRTNIGCGGILGAVSSRNRPLSFIVPSRDRDGQKGWLYTLPLKEPLEKLPELGMTEEETGLCWYPLKEWLPEEKAMGQMKRMYSLRKGCYAIGWTKLLAEKNGEYTIKGTNSGSIQIYLDDKRVYVSDKSGEFEFKIQLKYGCYNLFVINQCGETDWGFTAECLFEDRKVMFVNPLNVKGTDEKWIYAGPFSQPVNFDPEKICSADIPLDGAKGKVFWRLDKPHTVIRPYNDNKLFGHWNYPLGVTLYGLAEAGRFIKDSSLVDYVTKHVELCTRFFDYAMWDRDRYGAASMHNLLSTLSTLDDCGSFGSLMLEVSGELNDDAYVRIADYIADFIRNRLDRLPDGAFYRVNPEHLLMDQTLWADDLYMSVPFLCRYYKLTGRQEFIDDAAKQLVLYHKYLYRPDKKIMSHVYDVRHRKATEVSWGRGNGWVAFSYSELLRFLPENHELREELIRNFNDLCEGYLALQDEKGMWHQVLTDPDSYPEASCTSMFACAFARGVRNSWLNEPEKYIEAVEKAWKGLCSEAIDLHGNVYGICRGSGFSFSEDYYKNDLGWLLNDTHGTGIVLLAGVEYGKLLEWLDNGGI
ncbi:rhamnogalacturonyl hydrolase [Thermoclostridium stercorarium subsp. leptospartum DSM 9219]|jgi:unsaturated rhamnogalacturonyl hydrolase|uniref:Rhamnogalacturonyl hydrolase n=1 Tax=Thermoclostridium stercorarium subsp. leptospartum DSM 9219 TaxID=1346611 RepID=A0A1B1YJN6_THEST|nr:glycoside hydrolase family 88 protein [Thermoclostridium stercorarium]ANX00973.1 rhamnogalacturonyl hydrolase [Thermoclostridium stercorarium subsp. leptospartum DSM 9219]